jgi:hypothetical protein
MVSRWSAGISTVCSMVMGRSMPLSIAKKGGRVMNRVAYPSYSAAWLYVRYVAP